KDTKLRITWHTGEPGASIPATKAKIETAFGVRAYDLPGLTEIAAWGFECDARAGLTHVHEDYVYPEVLDEQGRPVKPGRARRAGVHQPLPQGDAAAALPHARHRAAGRPPLPV